MNFCSILRKVNVALSSLIYVRFCSERQKIGLQLMKNTKYSKRLASFEKINLGGKRSIFFIIFANMA